MLHCKVRKKHLQIFADKFISLVPAEIWNRQHTLFCKDLTLENLFYDECENDDNWQK